MTRFVCVAGFSCVGAGGGGGGVGRVGFVGVVAPIRCCPKSTRSIRIPFVTCSA